MSDYECIIYYGLRFPISVAEMDAIDEENDERINAAENEDLDYYCSDLCSLEGQYYLFIGQEIGVMGPDGEVEAELTAEEYIAITESVRTSLSRAGFQDTPQLHIQGMHVFY